MQHLDESGDGTNVETVATASEGSVSVSSDAVTAAFSVESFSTFTITWSSSWWEWWNTYFRITVHYVNESGNEISGSRTWNDNIGAGDRRVLANYAGDIENYTYSEARYGTYNGEVITRIEASSQYGNRRITFYNESKQVDQLLYYNGTVYADVYLVYQSDGNQTMNGLSKSVNFYVNLYSEIANSGSGTGNTKAENFSNSVKSTFLIEFPDSFSYIPSNDQYVVIQGASNGSAYEVDQEIRELGTNGVSSFKIEDFPTDAEVFEALQKMDESGWKNKDIIVGDEVITYENRAQLTTENYAIRWYVFKYDTSDCWHIDGILVPKYGRLTVTKCFDFGQAELTENDLLNLVPNNFTIQVEAGNNVYSLQMHEKTNNDSQGEPGWSSYTVESGKITFTWEVDVLNREYKISEQNADIPDYSHDAAEYQVTLFNGKQQSGTVGSEFSIKCETSGADSGTIAHQSVALKNTYSQSTGDLIISKDAYSALGGISEESFKFLLEVENEEGTYPAVYSSSSMDERTETITFTNGQAEISLKNGETVRISKLPIDTIVVITEKDSEGYKTTYTINSGTKISGKSCEVTISSDPQEVTFFNEKIIAIPTGVYMSGTPWVFMLGIAVVLCVGLIFLQNSREDRKH